MGSYQHIIVSTHGHAGLITLNRPKVLNALNSELMSELVEALKAFDQEDHIGAIVITGCDKAFAAGADIAEMADKSFADVYQSQFITREWAEIEKIQKPIIAAVSGYALGGGCELVMACDMAIASESAKFGQPEVTLGILPGAGGTQRLAKIVGKPLAMDMCLTGRQITATEALKIGLISRISKNETLLDDALQMANKIARFSKPVTSMIKQSVKNAFESHLIQGMKEERQLFYSSFALEDQKEGMQAFLEKRQPEFKHK